MYFHDKGTNRRVMLIGLMFCTAFVLVSFFARPQPENDRVLVKADRLTLTAGEPPLANYRGPLARAESDKKSRSQQTPPVLPAPSLIPLQVPIAPRCLERK